MSEELVQLVDSQDHETGVTPKMEAHRRGLLHRAFSVVLENERGEVLMQRRAAIKYHSPGLWSNACCGHPRPGEDTRAAAQRRLAEELGVDVELHEVGVFSYRAQIGDLVENEIDHVFVGRLSQLPQPDPDEVSETRWVAPDALDASMRDRPEDFTAWLAGVMRTYAHRTSR